MDFTENLKLLKSQGWTNSDIASACGITAGEVQRGLREISASVEKHIRKDDRKGHYRVSPFGDQGPVIKLAKSSVDPNEPEVIQKARRLLAQGHKPDDVCAALGITRMEMSKWLHRQWGV